MVMLIELLAYKALYQHIRCQKAAALLFAVILAQSIAVAQITNNSDSTVDIQVSNPFTNSHPPKSSSHIATIHFWNSVIGQENDLRKAKSSAILSELAQNKEQDSFEKRLLKVAALGALARASSTSESISNRYGSKSLAAIETLNEQYADEAWSKLLTGVWHYETTRRGGFMGAMLLGSSYEEGDKLINEAIKQNPNEPAFTFIYAVVLGSRDHQAYEEDILRLLALTEASVDKKTNTALYEKTAYYTAQLLAEMKKGVDDENNLFLEVI